MLKLRKNKKGFTLVELIVVIAIMAVLAGTIAGVTVSQLNKQTNNTAQSEVNTLMEDFKTFLLDYQLPAGTIGSDGKEIAPTTVPGTTDTTFSMGTDEWNSKDGITNVGELTYAIMEFAAEAKETKGLNYDILTKIPEGENPTLPKAGSHQFVFKVVDKTVTFSCQGKGTNAAVIKAEYTYSDVLGG